jgi:site-specific recombinase XerD
MTDKIILATANSLNAVAFIPAGSVKDKLHRLKEYVTWLDSAGYAWHTPDLAAYRDYLLYDYTGRDGEPLTPSSVATHLSTVRGRYRELLRDNRVRDLLYGMTPADASLSDRKAFVDEMLTRLRNAADPELSSVKVVKELDVDDEKHLRLTKHQAEALMRAPFESAENTPLQATRDCAIIALMLCTGIREMELIALDVGDLRTRFGGETALRVRRGKGCKARSIPYGDLAFCLGIADAWLSQAGVEQGAVFRGFYKGGKRLRSTRLTVRAINQILERYPISLEDRLDTVNPHDLRRTYARRLFDAGLSILAIQQNLGHADHKTTEGYIGTLHAADRRAPGLYHFDIATLMRG